MFDDKFVKIVPPTKGIYESKSELPTEIGDCIRYDSLYSHQMASYRVLKDNRNLLLSLETSAGKTLSVLPYLLEKIKYEDKSVLWLAPTKALMETIRIEADKFLNKLDLQKAVVMNSDVRKTERNYNGKFFITSTFSLDHLLKNPDFDIDNLIIVLDECHLLVNAIGGHYREIHKRLLLLRQMMGIMEPVQVAMLSATLANPEELIYNLFGDVVDEFDIIDESGAAQGERQLVLIEDFVNKGKLIDKLRSTGEKAILFCDSVSETQRLECETGVTAFHSQLTPAQRRDIMTKFSSGEITIITSTSCLECGVDVPNVKYVYTKGDNSISSVWQRLGRAGRGGEDGVCIIDISETGLPPQVYLDMPVENISPSLNPDLEKIHLLRLIADINQRFKDDPISVDIHRILANYPDVDDQRFLSCGLVEVIDNQPHLTIANVYQRYMLFKPPGLSKILLEDLGGLRRFSQTSTPKHYKIGNVMPINGVTCEVVSNEKGKIVVRKSEARVQFKSLVTIAKIDLNLDNSYQIDLNAKIKCRISDGTAKVSIITLSGTEAVSVIDYNSQVVQFIIDDYHYGALNALLRTARNYLKTDEIGYGINKSEDDESIISFFDKEEYNDGSQRMIDNLDTIVATTLKRLDNCKCSDGCINCTYKLPGGAILRKDVSRENASDWLRSKFLVIQD